MAEHAHTTPFPARRSAAGQGAATNRRAAPAPVVPIVRIAPAHLGLPAGTKLSGTVRCGPEMFPAAVDPDAFACVLRGDCMEPRLHDGDMAVISPATTITPGDLVMLTWADGRQPWLKILVQMPLLPIGTTFSADSNVVDAVIVEMLNPPRQFTIPTTKLTAMHRVVGTYRAEQLAEVRAPLPAKPAARRRRGAADGGGA